MTISYQLYSSRKYGPLSDTLKMLAELGYEAVEGYGALYANLEALDQLKAELAANRLHMASGHFGLPMVRDESARVLEIAKAVDMKAVIVPAVPKEERVKDAKGWAALGRELAEVGKPYWDAGLTFGWHNHDFEFAAIDSAEKPIDLILQGSDRLSFEFDIAWGAFAGEDPVKWIKKYGPRIMAAHIKDLAPKGQNLDEHGQADVGHGTMDWKGLMAALKSVGTSLYVIEHDDPSDDRRFASRSIASVKALQGAK